jgi:cytochrome oxidase Cu insertion factor (SCO1/SenC/PrrC family)
MTGARLFIVVVFAVVVAGCGGEATSRPADYRGSIPPPGIHAPDFALRSYRGPIVRMAHLRGKVVLVTFLDSKCTESCPIIAGMIAIAMHRLSPPERRQVEAVAITVQPHLDTPASVRRFLGARHALGALDFLIGSVQQLRPVWKAYGILPAVDTGSADIHSADVRVFNRDGIWVSTMHVPVDLTPTNLVHDIRTALGT